MWPMAHPMTHLYPLGRTRRRRRRAARARGAVGACAGPAGGPAPRELRAPSRTRRARGWRRSASVRCEHPPRQAEAAARRAKPLRRLRKPAHRRPRPSRRHLSRTNPPTLPRACRTRTVRTWSLPRHSPHPCPAAQLDEIVDVAPGAQSQRRAAVSAVDGRGRPIPRKWIRRRALRGRARGTAARPGPSPEASPAGQEGPPASPPTGEGGRAPRPGRTIARPPVRIPRTCVHT